MGRFAEGGEYGHAGLGIHAGLHLAARLHVAPDAMLHGVHGGQVVALVDDVDGAFQLPVHAGGVGHQADTAAAELLVRQLKTVNAAQNGSLFHPENLLEVCWFRAVVLYPVIQKTFYQPLHHTEMKEKCQVDMLLPDKTILFTSSQKD